MSNSIKDLATSLKERNGKINGNSGRKLTVSRNSKDSGDIFVKLRKVIRNKNYNCETIAYIDGDINEVFSLIKQKTKIPKNALISMILEQFIDENLSEISKLTSNKYLK